MWSLKNQAQRFIAHLSDTDRKQLHNELLAVQQVLTANQMTSFYLFSPFKNMPGLIIPNIENGYSNIKTD